MTIRVYEIFTQPDQYNKIYVATDGSCSVRHSSVGLVYVDGGDIVTHMGRNGVVVMTDNILNKTFTEKLDTVSFTEAFKALAMGGSISSYQDESNPTPFGTYERLQDITAIFPDEIDYRWVVNKS